MQPTVSSSRMRVGYGWMTTAIRLTWKLSRPSQEIRHSHWYVLCLLVRQYVCLNESRIWRDDYCYTPDMEALTPFARNTALALVCFSTFMSVSSSTCLFEWESDMDGWLLLHAWHGSSHAFCKAYSTGMHYVCLSACLSVYMRLAVCMSIYLSLYLFLSVCLSVYPSVSLSIRQFVNLSVCLFVCLSVC